MKLSPGSLASCIVWAVFACGLIASFLLLNVVDASKHPEKVTYFPKRAIIGAWIDNKNRTVYVCGCDVPKCQEVYWSMSAENTTTNTTRFGSGVLSLEDVDSDDYVGTFYHLTTNDDGNRTNIKDGKFHLNQDGDQFKGNLGGHHWVLKRRLYEQEPAPSICWKPARYEKVSKLQGKWQRTTSSGDQILFNMCPSGHGTFQWSIKGTKGIYRAGEFNNFNLTWYGKRFSRNFTYDDDRALLGGTAFVQSGSTILMEINTDPFGRFIERNQWSYIGLYDLEECDLELPEAFPIPYQRLSLLTYPGIVVAAGIAWLIRKHFFVRDKV